VVLFDAPPSIGHNLRRAVDKTAAAEGVSNTVTHLVYSHHHADHGAAASLFANAVLIGHEETRRLLLRDGDPARPAPEETFADTYTLEVGGERAELAWHGSNHSPDNPWSHLISGHLGRLATREDVAVHQQYIADIEAASREALASVDPVPYYMRYGENVWAGVKGHLNAVTKTRRRTRHRQVHRRAGGRRHRRVHHDHDVCHHAVAAPRQGPKRTRPSLRTPRPSSRFRPATAISVNGSKLFATGEDNGDYLTEAYQLQALGDGVR
jgi:hypothetical protein